MTIKMTRQAAGVTLVVYAVIFSINLAVLWLIVPAAGRDLARHDPSAAIDLLVAVSALALILIVLYSFAAFLIAGVHANQERVWVRRPLGVHEVKRSDLAAIQLGHSVQPLAGGMQIYQFIRHDGVEAFHIQKGPYSPADVLALATYLGIPFQTRS